MNKLLLTIALIMTGILGVQHVNAQTPTPEQDDNKPANVQQIEDLKERLATKVAELRNFQLRAISGKIKSQTVSSMTIETPTKDIKIELTDDIKVIQHLRGKRTELTVDDVDNGDNVVVFGQYDTTIDIMKADVIYIDNTSPQIRVHGVITELDEEEFTATVNSTDGIIYVIDIERTTNATEWSDRSMKKSGFSKLAVGHTVHVVGIAVPKEEKRISASRIITLGQLTQVTASPTGEPTDKEAVTNTPATSQTPKPTRTPTP